MKIVSPTLGGVALLLIPSTHSPLDWFYLERLSNKSILLKVQTSRVQIKNERSVKEKGKREKDRVEKKGKKERRSGLACDGCCPKAWSHVSNLCGVASWLFNNEFGAHLIV